MSKWSYLALVPVPAGCAAAAAYVSGNVAKWTQRDACQPDHGNNGLDLRVATRLP